MRHVTGNFLRLLPAVPRNRRGSGHRLGAAALCRTCATVSGCSCSPSSCPSPSSPRPRPPTGPMPAPASPGRRRSSTPARASAASMPSTGVRRGSAAAARSGGAAKVYRTTDGGRTWQDVSPPDTVGLTFRDVEATRRAHRDRCSRSARARPRGSTAPPTVGATWNETFRNDEPSGVLQLPGLLPRRPARPRGERPGRREVPDRRHRRRRPLVGGAARRRHARLDRRVQLLRQRRLPRDRRAATRGSAPAARPRGSSARPTAGSPGPRPTRPSRPARPPVSSASPSADPRHGVAVGGDFAAPADGVGRLGVPPATAAPGTRRRPDAPRRGRRVAPGTRRLLVVGESGTVGGSSVQHRRRPHLVRGSARAGFHTLDCTPDGTCWAAGGGGRVGRL